MSMENSNKPKYEILPIEVKRGTYSSSRYLYHAIQRNINRFNLNHISGAFVFDQNVKWNELKDMNINNWLLGRFQGGRNWRIRGVVFNEKSYFLVVSNADPDSLLEIAKKLCLITEKKAVLMKDCTADEMLLVRLKVPEQQHSLLAEFYTALQREKGQ